MARFSVVMGLVGLTMSLVACKAGETDAMKEKGDKEHTPATPPAKTVIDSPVAGSWYTSDGNALRLEIQGYLDDVDLSDAPKTAGRVAGLISPHAGYRFSGKVEAHGYSLLRDRKIRRIIVLGPSHHVGFEGFAVTRATHWRTPLGEAPLDPEGAGKLAGSDLFDYRENAFTREHSIDIQVPFIQVVAPNAKTLPVVVGQVGLNKAREAGRAIRALLDDETVVVASSDFTHYGDSFGYVPFTEDVEQGIKKLTDQAARAIVHMDAEAFAEHVESTGDTICGRAPIMTLLTAIPRRATALPLKFDSSGNMTGDWSHTVSYLSVALFLGENRGEFQGMEVLSATERKMLLDLARDTLKRHLS
ncbi:MAG: AmmeMemoRadiSam system protein B, partial [Deltaproteobacteria bacterium]|nr:AmmeMemoRadiSam system protein B [Deltaproteobacteria bacterium]